MNIGLNKTKTNCEWAGKKAATSATATAITNLREKMEINKIKNTSPF